MTDLREKLARAIEDALWITHEGDIANIEDAADAALAVFNEEYPDIERGVLGEQGVAMPTARATREPGL